MNLRLRGGCWDRLMLFCADDPDARHQSGGYQDRKAKWRDNLDFPSKSIELDDDDVDFIQRQLINRQGGGWQQKLADIFAGQHPAFSRLPVIPRKRRSP